MVWQQYRKVDAGTISVTDLDMDIEVVQNKNNLEFDVKIWNLTQDTWAGVSKGDECRVELGWKNGPSKSVIMGKIKKKIKETDGRDMVFRLQGVDQSNDTVKFAFTQTFDGKRPDQIAKAIASEIGLSTGEIEKSKKIEGYWAVTKDKPARYWLDQLVKEAEKRGNSAWEWFTDSGKLYFVKKDGRKEQAVELSYENTLLSIGEAVGGDDAEKKGLDFEAMCEPNIRKGGSVVVSTEDFSGAYKVTEYRFESSTVSGDHMVTGHLAPLGVNYKIS